MGPALRFQVDLSVQDRLFRLRDVRMIRYRLADGVIGIGLQGRDLIGGQAGPAGDHDADFGRRMV
ncbi:hypothetical protein M1L60_13435 [Actinoplanes sp. TRM 88003]|uniref:Uncharacterized protein n=1 Tax=Paractinoplanes aksuensis TaxID=2939490 RepID=A0ABT1DL89_9ACTN|nr:hypothetical protein [Actinoplanes aksuensis]MCO8271595.1 hypothetical protein [Actinoplanes aksuensis]